ncbi:MAG: TonB-dependent receptor [Bacteroidales bacterium]|nr:TonB-dependent receptor [Bacteroidales bacterium]MCF8456949.1 TonB-dependent receptor [Bacteroidales bacterium]
MKTKFMPLLRGINLLIATILICLNPLQAQGDYTQTIRGTILDKHSQVTLPGASVVLLNSDPLIGVSSDVDGKFRLENVPVGRHSLQFSFMGYEPVVINNVDLGSGKELVLTVEMEEKVITTKEVVVYAKFQKDETINKMATVSARSFSVEETQRYAGSLGDPSRMAANFAGVVSSNDRRNDIVIRGNSPMGLLWRLEGIEIPNPNHFGAMGTTGGPVSMLNNNLLTNSDFFSGAFPAEYGNALAGAFDLRMRSGNNEKPEYVGQIGFNGFELGAEGPFSKSGASYLVNYRYSTLDVMHKLGLEFGTGSAVPEYQDLSFKVDVPGTKAGHFSLFGLGGKSFIALDNEEGWGTKEVYTEYGSDMGVIGLNHQYFFTDKSRLKTSVSYSGFRTKTLLDSLVAPDYEQGYAYYRSTLSETKLSFATQHIYKLSASDNFKTGIILDHFNVNYVDSFLDYEIGGFRTLTLNKGSMDMSRAFTQWQHKFNDHLVLNSGLHFSYFNFNKEARLEPRLGIRWSFSGNQALNFGYGYHSQLQPKMNYFIQTRLDNGTYIETNRDLKMSRSQHFVVGYDRRFAQDFRLKLEAYYQQLSKIPVSQTYTAFSMLNAGDFFAIPHIDSLMNEGTGKNYGLELTVEKFFSEGYYFLVTASLYDSKYKAFDGIQRNTTFNGNFIVNALGGYELKVGSHNAIAFDLKAVYGGNKRYIPLDWKASIAQGEEEYNWDEAFKNRYPNYLRIDVRLSFKLNGKKINQEWALDIQNVTNNKNILVEQFQYNAQDSWQSKLVKQYQTELFPMMTYRIFF